MYIIIGILAGIIILQSIIMWKYQRQVKDICRQLAFLMKHDSNMLIHREFGLGGINSHYKNENDFIIKKSTGDILYAPLGLSNMKVPEGVRTLPKYFLRYSSVKKISLPKSLASIGNYALDGPELESISLDEGNKKYKERMGCIVTSNEKRLVAVASETGIISIPEKVTSLEAGISMGRRGSLKRILIPKSVKKLKKGWQSLYLCSHSEDVELRFLSAEPP